jgi:maleate isomerase
MLCLPVTSTSVCTVRNMLDLLEIEPSVPNCGKLLGDSPYNPAIRVVG